jgi:hypothetical protein
MALVFKLEFPDATGVPRRGAAGRISTEHPHP